MTVTIINGDSLIELLKLEENSIDSIVTDPPYELGFMGKKWDSTGIAYNIELWKLVLRVLKPGGHLLSFGGTRTYHRMVCAIEDAGFEIRDQIQWIYGQGFPKSLNISKAMDRKVGAVRKTVGYKEGYSLEQRSGDKYLDTNVFGNHKGMYGHREDSRLRAAEVTAPATEDAKKWDGWGTALKPTNEPICLARKPVSEKTIVENILKWGTGGLNIDGCRIELNGEIVPINKLIEWSGFGELDKPEYEKTIKTEGRFPANVIFDEEASESLGNASRFYYVIKTGQKERNAGLEGMPKKKTFSGGLEGGSIPLKGSPIPEAENNHPTVKPSTLMAYLCRLVTPKGGIVLDPFMGSGSTGIGAIQEGFSFIGIEKDLDYTIIAEKRIAYYV